VLAVFPEYMQRLEKDAAKLYVLMKMQFKVFVYRDEAVRENVVRAKVTAFH
jgi:hypothetical protein